MCANCSLEKDQDVFVSSIAVHGSVVHGSIDCRMGSEEAAREFLRGGFVNSHPAAAQAVLARCCISNSDSVLSEAEASAEIKGKSWKVLFAYDNAMLARSCVMASDIIRIEDDEIAFRRGM